MVQNRRRRQRATGSRTSKPVEQKWPETMAELNALPEASKPSASEKPTVSSRPQAEGARHSQNIQKVHEVKPNWQESDLQLGERLLNSPFLKLQGGALTVTRPAQASQKQSTPAFADPAILEAQKIQRARDAILSSPYLTVDGNVLKVTRPVLEQPTTTTTGLAGRAATQNQQGLLRTFTPYKDPEPAPGPPPDQGQTYPQQPIGSADPALLEAQKINDKRLTGMIDPALIEAQKVYDKMLTGAIDPGLSEAQQFVANKNQYGINIDAFLKAAQNQINTKEGANNNNPYGTWYGNPNDAWCAQFASWAANQVGSLNTDLTKNSKGIPKNQSTSHFAADYKSMERYANGYQYSANKESAYKPKAGDIVFFDWGHTGIVVAFDEQDGIVYTIEGNSGKNSNGVYYHTRSYKTGGIKGYGINGGTSYGTIPDLSRNAE